MNDSPIHIIVNPHSGYGGQKLHLAELCNELRLAGRSTVEYVTKSSGDATRRAREIVSDASVVVAWGGDGTVNEVANGLAGSSVAMMVVRAGTENLLANELGIPRNVAAQAQVILEGRTMDFDIGLINGQSFHSILGVGFDAEVVRRLSMGRVGHISHLSYFWPIWRTFWEHDFPDLHITADGEEVFHGKGLAFVGNISRYSVGLRICRHAKFDDGLLDLVVFKCSERSGLVLHAAWTMLRLHPLKGNVIYRLARKIHIESAEKIPCELDGDIGPDTPLDISVAPHKIKILVPGQQSRWTLPLWPWKGAPL